MNKKLGSFIIAVLLGGAGFWLLAEYASFAVASGVFLLLWGNNIAIDADK